MKNIREEKSKLGILRFFRSFKYTFQGLQYAFRYEQNMIAHLLATFIVVTMGFLFHLSILEWVVIFFAIGLVIGAELLNTAIEAVVDLITPNIHPLAKVAKDTASASVFVFAMSALVAGVIIFLPKIMILF